jgi:hypothetical protein
MNGFSMQPGFAQSAMQVRAVCNAGWYDIAAVVLRTTRRKNALQDSKEK